MRFSRLVVEQPWINESDINPLLALPERCLVLDARVVLQPLEMKPEELPRPAARTYPAQYVSHFTMKNGVSVLIRPIRPEDEPLMVKFHTTLSDQTVYLRYFHMENLSARVAHERLVRKYFIDYHREMALAVEREEPSTGERLSRPFPENSAQTSEYPRGRAHLCSCCTSNSFRVSRIEIQAM